MSYEGRRGIGKTELAGVPEVLMLTPDGLVNVPSGLMVKETADRVTTFVVSKGLTLFARIDHAENARQVGMELRPTELLIFGNPKAGTILMQDQQLSGFDLPIRVLVWQDDDGKVWLTYNDTAWLAARYRLGARSDATLRAIGEGAFSAGELLGCDERRRQVGSSLTWIRRVCQRGRGTHVRSLAGAAHRRRFSRGKARLDLCITEPGFVDGARLEGTGHQSRGDDPEE
jgi:uncharacterized protein (DUF302 family)